jgi:multidrug resistance efflux pump
MTTGPIYRKAALERLKSPEQLDTLMRVTDAKGWLALLGCSVIIAAALVWGALGTIQTKVSASGILLSGRGLTEVTAQGDGQIVSLEVEAGAEIKKGQIIARIDQPELKAQIDNTEARLDRLAPGDAGAVVELQSHYRERLEGELQRLKRQLAENGKVTSPADGRVVEVRAIVGGRVSAGTPIVALEASRAGHDELEALLYFDSHQGKLLKPGMTIELVPSVVRKERYGVLLGRVRSVEDFPSTRLGMLNALRNEQLVDSFIQEAGGAPIAIRADLVADAGTPSGYHWSSGKGPDVVLTGGTRCTGSVITRSQRPLALIFPALDSGD